MWEFTQLTVWVAKAKEWFDERIVERTTWDGTVIVAVCGSYILFESLIGMVAYAGVLYGLWTIWKEEQK